MHKVLAIVWKDLLSTVRDTSALLMMVATPFLVTMVMTFAFGREGGSVLRDIPVHVVNYDRGDIGAQLVEVFQSDELADLIEPALSSDEAASRTAVDTDRITAVVIVPEDFSERVLAAANPLAPGAQGEAAAIEIYANPGRTVSASVIHNIVEQIVAVTNAGTAGVKVSLEKLIASGRLPLDQVVSVGDEIGERMTAQIVAAEPIVLRQESRFDWLNYFAPSLAIVFLTMTMTWHTRTILEEHERGTLPRLMTTATSTAQFMAGKILGSLAIGLLQMAVLVGATGWLLGVNWGAVGPLSALIAITVTVMTCLGLLVATVSHTVEQAADYGQMVVILLAALGGHLLPLALFPGWVQTLGYVTPNAWSMEAFAQLGQGGGLADIALHLLVLAGMAIVFFAISVVALRRQAR